MSNGEVKIHIGTPEDMGRLGAPTPRRLHLLRHVRRHPAPGIKVLAADLHRDDKNVHRDVDTLTRLGLPPRTAQGVVAPYAAVDAGFVL